MVRPKKDVPKKVTPAKVEEVNVVETQEVNEAQSGDNMSNEADLPTSKETVAPVSIAGKAVPMSVSGKARLFDTRKNRIITGFIDFKRAEQQVKEFDHIEILNEKQPQTDSN